MWQKERSAERPVVLDFNSSPGHVIERKNITIIESGDNEEARIEYKCDMRFVSVNEYLESQQKTIDTLVISNLGV